MATEAATPYLGSQGEFVETDEVKIETVFPFYLQSKVISAMLGVHPYEEVAYDVIPLDNQAGNVGLGVAGYLSEAVKADVFLSHVKMCLDVRPSSMPGMGAGCAGKLLCRAGNRGASPSGGLIYISPETLSIISSSKPTILWLLPTLDIMKANNSLKNFF